MSSPPPRPGAAPVTRTPWGAVLVFASAAFLTSTTSLMTAGLLPAMARDLSVSEGAAGSLTSVFALAIVVTILPLTRLTLRLDRRTVLVGTAVLLVLSNLLVALAPGLGIALVGRFLGGTAHGLLSSAMAGVAARLIAPELMPRAMGAVLAGNSAGLAVGAPLAAFLGTAVGWRPAFGLAALLGLVIAVALFRVVPPVHIAASRAGSVVEAVCTPGVLQASASTAVMLLGHYATLAFIAPLFVGLGGDPADVGIPLLVIGFAGMAGVLLAGRVPIDRILAGAICTVLLLAAVFAVLAGQPPLPLVYALLAFWGAAQAASLLMNQQAVIVLGHRAPELALGLFLLVTQVGVALGAAAGGTTLETFGPTTLPLVAAGAMVLAVLLLLGLPPRFRAARSAQHAAPAT